RPELCRVEPFARDLPASARLFLPLAGPDCEHDSDARANIAVASDIGDEDDVARRRLGIEDDEDVIPERPDLQRIKPEVAGLRALRAPLLLGDRRVLDLFASLRHQAKSLNLRIFWLCFVCIRLPLGVIFEPRMAPILFRAP